MLHAALEAFTNLWSPVHLLFLIAGVLMGLMLGAVPGLGGITGLAILLPFTYSLPPTQATLKLETG
jgi:TctA family transporter